MVFFHCRELFRCVIENDFMTELTTACEQVHVKGNVSRLDHPIQLALSESSHVPKTLLVHL